MTDHLLIVILGPTATGKTRLAVQVARTLNGEIISADSRQVYRSMDIGTGKDLAEYHYQGYQIPYHLIDILDPSEDYSVYHFQQDFHQVLLEIQTRRNPAILCGGTGLYIEAVLQDFQMHDVPADLELREKLQSSSLEELQMMLADLNPDLHNTTDLLHRKRMIRAIEIAHAQPASDTADSIQSQVHPVESIVLGVQYPRGEVRRRITERLRSRLQSGLIQEVQRLLDGGLSHDRLEYFGLEYRFISRHLQGELSWNDMFQKLNTAIHQFAKRQMTFFRHMEKKGIHIHWIERGDPTEAMKVIQARLDR